MGRSRDRKKKLQIFEWHQGELLWASSTDTRTEKSPQKFGITEGLTELHGSSMVQPMFL